MFIRDDIFDYARHGMTRLVKKCLENGVDVNTMDDLSGWTPLITASHYARVDVVTLLLEEKADVDIQNFDKETALHWAVLSGRMDIVKLLIQHHANIHARDNKNDSALTFALKRGYSHIAIFLLKYGADINDLFCEQTAILSHPFFKTSILKNIDLLTSENQLLWNKLRLKTIYCKETTP